MYLRVLRMKWNEPRREGTYKMVRATPKAVQVEGSTSWYHLNHCTRVPKIKPRRLEVQVVEEEGGQAADTSEESQEDTREGLKIRVKKD